MFRSEPLPADTRARGGGIRPVVTMLNATPDPLGSLAALYGVYTGRIARNLSEVTDEQRREAWADMSKTILNGPLEAIQFHFLVEGVSRAFTHQAVRNRFSFFAQESLRFAVVDEESWVDRQAYPPSLAADPEEGRRIPPPSVPRITSQYVSPEAESYAARRAAWDRAIVEAQQSYRRLVDAGVPAEDARGLMPHSIGTRYFWVVSLRTLLEEAGKRLCTQAQFEWRMMMAEVAKAIREYGQRHYKEYYAGMSDARLHGPVSRGDGWQFELLAEALKPVCYQEGKCGFKGKFDRACKIRERVDANEANGRPSTEWGRAWIDEEDEYVDHATGKCGDPDCSLGDEVKRIRAIRPEEWLLDPGAAR